MKGWNVPIAAPDPDVLHRTRNDTNLRYTRHSMHLSRRCMVELHA